MRMAVLCVVFFGGAAWGQAPQEIVDRAVRIHGGSDALAKTRAMIQFAQGRLNFQGVDVDATREGKWALPDRAYWTVQISRQGQKFRTNLVLDGFAGWMDATGQPARNFGPQEYDMIAEEAYVYSLCTILPLSKKELTLAAAPPADVDGQPCVGVKVTKAARQDVTLFFSKGTGLLRKATFRGKEAGIACTKDFVFDDHKEYSGIKLPTKVTDFKDATRMAQWTVTEYKFVDKFDANAFKKP